MIIENRTYQLPTGPGRYTYRPLYKIQYLVIHHMAHPDWSVEEVADYHTSKRSSPFPGIGYHFFITKSGRVIQTNELTTRSYHVRGMNTKCLGIGLQGNFEIEQPTEEQYAAVRELLKILYKLLPGRELVGHSDLRATLCPGKHFDFSRISQTS